MSNAYQETIFLLKKYGITANKSLGQNFLINDKVIQTTIEEAHISKEDLVIEIGPGLGTLTSCLLERARKVIAIELDSKMVKIAKERFALYPNFEIIQEDILKVDLQRRIEKERKENKVKEVKIVANLPYYITTPIIMKLLEDNLKIESITVMVQKEVAERLIATPGEKLAGAITYSVQYYCKTEKVIEVPKESFIPTPEVESEVIKLTLREKPPVELKDKDKFFKLIKVSFMQRRKTFLNSVSNSGFIDKQKLRKILEELEIKETIRGENLSLEQFAQISDKL